MKRYLISVFPLSVLILLLPISLTQESSGQPRPTLDRSSQVLSDKKRDELIGPVKSVQFGINLLSVRSNEYLGDCSFYQTNCYDVDGRKVKEEHKPGCGLIAREEDIHDSEGRVIERLTYGEGGQVRSRIQFIYNWDGNRHEAYFYGEDGELESLISYSYKYDHKGNWIERVGYRTGGNSKREYDWYGVECRRIEYYE